MFQIITRLKNIYYKLPYLIYDLRYSVSTKTFPIILYCLYFILKVPAPSLAYKLLLMSCRANFNQTAIQTIKKNIDKIPNDAQIGALKLRESEVNLTLGRTIILKAPNIKDNGSLSKGIILIKFTESFTPFIKIFNVPKLQSKYILILEPSWSGYALESILAWSSFENPIYIEAAESKDYDFVKEMACNLVPIRCGSGDWVDYRVFNELMTPKIYNCVYVANYTPIKRIHSYLEAIYKFSKKHPNSKFALVCSKWGSLRKNVHGLIKTYNITQNIDVFENLSHIDLNKVLSQSKANILLSLREGSNRSLFESMFTNIPAIILDQNIGVNKENFVSESGIVISEQNLTEAFEEVKTNWASFKAREWALKNIAPEVTLDKIIRVIEKNEHIHVEKSQLRYKVNSPEANYMYKKGQISEEHNNEFYSYLNEPYRHIISQNPPYKGK